MKAMMRNTNVVLLNVLSAGDHAKRHIKDSENLPLGPDIDNFVRAVEKRYSKFKFIITYCSGLSCDAGSNAAKILRKQGFRVVDYPGGLQEWSEAGLPTEGNETGQPTGCRINGLENEFFD